MWTLTSVELASTVCRRIGTLYIAVQRDAEAFLDAMESIWRVVDDVHLVASRARELLMTHRLTAADALQLAAAIVAANGKPQLLPFVTLDHRLADAARAEGFPVLP